MEPAIEAPAADEAPATDEAPGPGDDGRSWLVVPGAFYAQETSVGFGLLGSVTVPVGEAIGTWPSTAGLAVAYTLENQAAVASWLDLYLGAENAWAIEGDWVASHFPRRYFGIGDRPVPVYQTVTVRSFAMKASALRRLADAGPGKVYVGVADAFSAVTLRDVGPPVTGEDATPVSWPGEGQLGSGTVLGEEGGIVHGVGVGLRYESRDNAESTRRGAYGTLRVLGHAPWTGSRYGFTSTSFDARAFQPVGPDVTLAAQWVSELGIGGVPVTHMAVLGGNSVLRGMYEGRFRDRGMTAVQAELRFPIAWRFRGVLFADAGQVFSVPADLVSSPPKWTAGAGLRFELDQVAHSTVRLDVGGGPDGSGLIVNFGEAF